MSEPFDMEAAEERASWEDSPIASDVLRLAQMLRDVTKERDQLKGDLDGEVGFIGHRAASRVWQGRAKKAEFALREEIKRADDNYLRATRAENRYREAVETLELVVAHYDLAERMGETGGPGLQLPRDAAEVAYHMRASIRTAGDRARDYLSLAAHYREAVEALRDSLSRLEEHNSTCSELYTGRAVLAKARTIGGENATST